MDETTRMRIRDEFSRLRGMDKEDYVTFAAVCVNLFEANKRHNTERMDSWLASNNLTKLKQLTQDELIRVAGESLDHYNNKP
jgi:hypothetical protein